MPGGVSGTGDEAAAAAAQLAATAAACGNTIVFADIDVMLIQRERDQTLRTTMCEILIPKLLHISICSNHITVWSKHLRDIQVVAERPLL